MLNVLKKTYFLFPNSRIVRLVMALIRVLTYQGGDERGGDNAGEKGFGLLGVVRRFLFGLIEDWGNQDYISCKL
jgi:hypothetical protein